MTSILPRPAAAAGGPAGGEPNASAVRAGDVGADRSGPSRRGGAREEDVDPGPQWPCGLLALAGCGRPTAATPRASTSSSSAGDGRRRPTPSSRRPTATSGRSSSTPTGGPCTCSTRTPPGPGASACSGECLAKWPPVVAASALAVTGVTGRGGHDHPGRRFKQVTLGGDAPVLVRRGLPRWRRDGAGGRRHLVGRRRPTARRSPATATSSRPRRSGTGY